MYIIITSSMSAVSMLHSKPNPKNSILSKSPNILLTNNFTYTVLVLQELKANVTA